MIQGIHHVAISTGNLERLVAFYCDLLGFELACRGGWPQGTPEVDAVVGLKNSAARTVMLRSRDFYLEIFEFSAPAARAADPNRPVCDHGYTHFCLAVSDLDAEHQRLSAAGVQFHCAPARKEGKAQRAAYARDPDGNVIELLEILTEPHPFAKIRALA